VSLRIRLLGGLLLESNGRILPRIPSRPGRSLFAYLVVNRDRQVTRDLLAGLFWPDMPDNQARRRLSQALWHVQSMLTEAGLAEPYLITTPSAVRFNPNSSYWLDVDVFEGATETLTDAEPAKQTDGRALAEAVELYRGDLLAGFYDNWIFAEQQRLRELYHRALVQLSRVHKGKGEFEDALIYARRLALLEPLREDVHRDVMRLCVLAGRPNDALLQYEVAFTALADELGTEPEEATTRLFESIAAQRMAGTQAFVPSMRSPLFDLATPVPMVGREGLRSLGVEAMESAIAGRGVTLLVEGEPGVGKTRLLEAMADDANWRGFGVLWSEAQEGDAARSYQPLAAALTDALSPLRAGQLAAQVDALWLHELARLVPDLTKWLPELPPAPALEPSEEAGRMREAISTTLVGLGRITPVLLILDDFQWADADTVAAVTHLTSVIDDAPVVVCLSYRSAAARAQPDVWAGLRQIDAHRSSRRLEVEALTPGETAELIRVSSSSDADGDLVQRIHAEAGGNPLFVLETLRAMHDHTLAALDADELLADFPGSSDVSSLIARRLHSLGAAERAVLDLFAVGGLSGNRDVVATALDRPRPEFLQALDVLVSRGILYERDDAYRFRHDQVRRAVLAELGSGAVERLHGDLAEAITRLDPLDAEAIAHHLTSAGRAGEATLHALRAADRAVAMRAYSTAATHYRMALDGLPAGERFGVLQGYERVLDVLGQRQEQAIVLDEMEELAGEHRAEVLRRIAWHRAHTDRFDEARRAAGRALEMDSTAEAMAEDYIVLGTIGLWSGDFAIAVEHLRAAASAASSVAEQAVARRSLGSALSAVQEYDQALAEAEAALALSGRADDPRGEAEALGLLGIITMERGEAEVAVDYYDRAVILSHRIGYRHGEAVHTANRGNALWYGGQIHSALQSLAEAIGLFESLGNRRGVATVQANAASIYHSVVGDDETAAAYCQSALAYFTEVGNRDGVAQVLCNLADISRRAGDFDKAAEHLRQGLEAVEQTGNRWLEVQLLHSRARGLLEAGQDGAAEVCREGLRLCRELGLVDFEASLLSLEGVALVEAGDLGGGLEAADEAMKVLKPGTDQDYLVPYRHGLVSEAAGLESQARESFGTARGMLAERLGGLTPEQRSTALAAPEHRAIEHAASSRRPQKLVVDLAGREAPSGRPLMPADLVSVSWTVTDPSDSAVGDPAEVRRHRLRRLLVEADAQGAAATVADLAKALGASVRTIRRDLQELRSGGVEVFTRGSRRRAAGNSRPDL